MGKVGIVAELVVKNKINLKCEGCGRAIQFTIDDDGYIWLPTGALRFDCQHCKKVYEMTWDINPVMEGKNDKK